MPSVPKRRKPAQDDATIREAAGDLLLALLDCGRQYVREHPDVRAGGRRADDTMIRRLLVAEVDEDDAEA